MTSESCLITPPFSGFLEDREDAEDAAYIAAHKDEPSIPLEEALKELGL